MHRVAILVLGLCALGVIAFPTNDQAREAEVIKITDADAPIVLPPSDDAENVILRDTANATAAAAESQPATEGSSGPAPPLPPAASPSPLPDNVAVTTEKFVQSTPNLVPTVVDISTPGPNSTPAPANATTTPTPEDEDDESTRRTAKRRPRRTPMRRRTTTRRRTKRKTTTRKRRTTKTRRRKRMRRKRSATLARKRRAETKRSVSHGPLATTRLEAVSRSQLERRSLPASSLGSTARTTSRMRRKPLRPLESRRTLPVLLTRPLLRAGPSFRAFPPGPQPMKMTRQIPEALNLFLY